MDNFDHLIYANEIEAKRTEHESGAYIQYLLNVIRSIWPNTCMPWIFDCSSRFHCARSSRFCFGKENAPLLYWFNAFNSIFQVPCYTLIWRITSSELTKFDSKQIPYFYTKFVQMHLIQPNEQTFSVFFHFCCMWVRLLIELWLEILSKIKRTGKHWQIRKNAKLNSFLEFFIEIFAYNIIGFPNHTNSKFAIQAKQLIGNFRLKLRLIRNWFGLVEFRITKPNQRRFHPMNYILILIIKQFLNDVSGPSKYIIKENI